MPETKYDPNLRNAVRELRGRRQEAAKAAYEEPWPSQDSSLESFAYEFGDTLPGKWEEVPDTDEVTARFINYIERSLGSDRAEQLTAVEFGGLGINLFRGFPKDFFQKTVGISLNEGGTTIKSKAKSKAKDSSHVVIEGDLLDNKTYQKLNGVLKGKKVNLIISRIQGPVNETYLDPAIYAKLAQKWYGLLSNNGIMFVQYRNGNRDRWISGNAIEKDVREKLMREWAAYIEQNYGKTLEIQLGWGSFRLCKKGGAPAKLPLLPFFDETPTVETR